MPARNLTRERGITEQRNMDAAAGGASLASQMTGPGATMYTPFQQAQQNAAGLTNINQATLLQHNVTMDRLSRQHQILGDWARQGLAERGQKWQQGMDYNRDARDADRAKREAIAFDFTLDEQKKAAARTASDYSQGIPGRDATWVLDTKIRNALQAGDTDTAARLMALKQGRLAPTSTQKPQGITTLEDVALAKHLAAKEGYADAGGIADDAWAAALDRSGGDRAKAAALLGIERVTPRQGIQRQIEDLQDEDPRKNKNKIARLQKQLSAMPADPLPPTPGRRGVTPALKAAIAAEPSVPPAQHVFSNTMPATLTQDQGIAALQAARPIVQKLPADVRGPALAAMQKLNQSIATKGMTPAAEQMLRAYAQWVDQQRAAGNKQPAAGNKQPAGIAQGR